MQSNVALIIFQISSIFYQLKRRLKSGRYFFNPDELDKTPLTTTMVVTCSSCKNLLYFYHHRRCYNCYEYINYNLDLCDVCINRFCTCITTT